MIDGVIVLADTLKTLTALLPAISEATLKMTLLTITDRERFLAYVPARDLDVGIKPGDLLEHGGSTYQAIQQNKTIIAQIPAEVSGVPYIAATVPIVENGVVIGSIATAYPMKRETALDQMSIETANVVRQTRSAIEGLLDVSKSLAASAQTLNDLAANTSQSAVQADSMAGFIRDVADNTQLLGLNAAIESARAGEYGKGFDVVAKEIRKMATSNKDAAKSINKFVQDLQTSIGNVASHAQDLGAVSEELTASLQDIANNTENLTVLAEKLEHLASLSIGNLAMEKFSK